MKKRILKISGVILICIFISIVTGLCFTINHYLSKVQRTDIDRSDVINVGQENNIVDKDIIQIALIGTDKAHTDKSSSDSMIILNINKKTNEIKLASLMRDVLVEIPGYEPDNLNKAIIKGGPELTLKTINLNFNLAVDKFVQVNLARLPKIIDLLGGVEMEITEDELEHINSYIRQLDVWNKTKTEPITKLGNQLLDGTQASAYCRIRYTSGRDFRRTERQREVLEALFKKFNKVSAKEMLSIINEVLPLLETNLTNKEIIDIGLIVLKMKDTKFEQAGFPNINDQTAEFVDGYYHMYMDKGITLEKLHKFLYGDKREVTGKNE